MRHDIFISYRRSGGGVMAHNLFEYLSKKGYLVFRDIESLHSGKYDMELYRTIQGCTDFILILSPNGLDRCNDEDDWVRKEIACAIKMRKNIIPVCLPGFEWPEELPEDIADICNYNAVIVHMEHYDACLRKIVSFLDSKIDIYLPDMGRQSIRALSILGLLALLFIVHLAHFRLGIFSDIGLLLTDIILCFLLGVCWQRFMKVVFLKRLKDRLKASLFTLISTLIFIGLIFLIGFMVSI